MGGIGKTELARQYIKTYRAEYTTVVFARYETDLISLLADDNAFSVHGVVRKLKVSGEMQSDEEYALEKLRIISSNSDSRTLIVIDNYDTMMDAFLNKLCSSGDFRLLITTRYDQDTKKYKVLPVGELSDADLKAFMIDCCDREYLQLDENDPGFDRLFELTDRHTLTLELLAKYMCENSIDTVGELVELLLQKGFSLPSETQIAYESRFATVAGIIDDLFRMTALTDEETLFMHYLAMMPPSGINQQYFRRWCGPVYAQARTRLLKLSLVRFDADERKLMLHPIIRQTVLNNFKLSYQDCAPFIDRLVCEISENIAWNYPVEKKEILSKCCLSIIDCVKEITEQNFVAIYQIAVFLNFTDEYERCCQRFERLRETASRMYGDTSVQMAQVLYRIGWLSGNRMKYQVAQQYLIEALRLFEPHKKIVAGDYIHCLCDYANSLYTEYRECGGAEKLEREFSFAMQAYEMGELAVRENLCQEAHLRKGLAASTLVKYYTLTQQYDLAMDKVNEAIEEYRTLEDCFLDMASLHAKKGMLYAKMGDHAAKESLYQAIELYKAYGGRYSGTYFDCLWTLILCLEREGDVQAALEYGKKTLEYAGTVYEENHEKIKMVKQKIDDLARKMQ